MRILLLAAVLLAAPMASAGLVVTSPSEGAAVGPDFMVEGRFEESPESQFAATPGFLGRVDDALLFEGDAPPAAHATGLHVQEHVQLERPLIRYEEVRDVSLGMPPGQASGIQPGSHILMDRPDGTFGCTANYIWRDHSTQTLYLGAAGHCFLPEDKTATHGPGKDYDPAKTKVRVCVAECQFGGQLGFIFTGQLQDLGAVAYARQVRGSAQVGNDFGVVEIPSDLYDLVEPAMAVWGGPSETTDLRLGDRVVHFGNAGGLGEHFSTQARAGIGGGSDADSWIATTPSFQGDSGAALNTARTEGTSLVGDAAAGVLTHLVAGTQLGYVAGTTMPRAVAMAMEAGLDIEVAFEGEAIPGFGQAVPLPPVDVQAAAGDQSVRLSWRPAPDGPAATDYVVRYGEVPGGPYPDEAVVEAAQASIAGLANGATYYFVVHARNDAGESNASAQASAVPQEGVAAPSAPRGLAALAGEASVDLTWDPPAEDGGAAVTGYTVRWSMGSDGFTHSMRTASTSATVDGLAGGKEHTFVVHARNDAGEGPPSNEARATPFEAAEPVRVVEVRLGQGAWQRAEQWDGQSFRHIIRGAGDGDHVLEVQLVQDGQAIASESRQVRVQGEPVDEDGEGKRSPGLLWLGAVAAIAVALASRRQAG